ncbi:MAG: hypothetical protein ACJ76X_13765 [Solirubrobacteraceae bacterium]
MYLTDETFLYRVIGLTAGANGGTVELEDCYRLEVVEINVRGLQARGLRAVTPLPSAAGAPVPA